MFLLQLAAINNSRFARSDVGITAAAALVELAVRLALACVHARTEEGNGRTQIANRRPGNKGKTHATQKVKSAF